MNKVPNFEFNADTLKGKNILITGAGSGIGKQLALDAAQAGANLILLSKDVHKLYALQDQIVQNNNICLLYTSPSPRDQRGSRMPSSA